MTDTIPHRARRPSASGRFIAHWVLGHEPPDSPPTSYRRWVVRPIRKGVSFYLLGFLAIYAAICLYDGYAWSTQLSSSYGVLEVRLIVVAFLALVDVVVLLFRATNFLVFAAFNAVFIFVPFGVMHGLTLSPAAERRRQKKPSVVIILCVLGLGAPVWSYGVAVLYGDYIHVLLRYILESWFWTIALTAGALVWAARNIWVSTRLAPAPAKEQAPMANAADSAGPRVDGTAAAAPDFTVPPSYRSQGMPPLETVSPGFIAGIIRRDSRAQLLTALGLALDAVLASLPFILWGLSPDSRPGDLVCVGIVGVPIWYFVLWNLWRSVQAARDPRHHPVRRALERFGDPDAVIAEIEASLSQAHPVCGMAHLTPRWLVAASDRSCAATRLDNIVRLYRHETRYYARQFMAQVSTGRTTALKVWDKDGTELTIPGPERAINILLAELANRLPGAQVGYNEECMQAWRADREAVTSQILNRRRAAAASGDFSRAAWPDG